MLLAAVLLRLEILQDVTFPRVELANAFIHSDFGSFKA